MYASYFSLTRHIDVSKRSRSLIYTTVIETGSHQDALSNGNDDHLNGKRCSMFSVLNNGEDLE